MARGSSTGIILILFMCVIFVIGGGLYVYTTRDQEGDTCTGDDPNAEYTLDQDLNCTFVQCYPGFGINEDGACVFIAEEKATTELELAREDLKLKQLAAQSAEITSEGEKSKAAAELVAAEDRQRAAALALEAAKDERKAAEIEREAELAAELVAAEDRQRAAALALEAAKDERKAAEIEREAELAAEAAESERKAAEIAELAAKEVLVVECKKFRIKGRYRFYLKDMGDGGLRTDKRNVPGTKGWEFEGSFPNNLRIKGPNGYYLKDMDIDEKVRFDKRSTVPGVGGWSIEGLKLNDVRIKSARGRYLAMKTDGALYMHKSKKKPDANAWKLVCAVGDIIT